MDYIRWFYLIAYGLTQVITFKRLASRQYDCKIYIMVFIFMLLWIYIVVHNYFGEFIFGFMLSLLIVPTLIIGIPMMIYNHKISVPPLVIGFLCQIVYIASDTLALAMTRMIAINGSFFQPVYYLITPVFAFLVSYVFYYLQIIIKRIHIKKDKYVFLFSGVVIMGTSLFIFYFLLLQRYSLRERGLFAIGLATMLIFILACLMFMAIYGKYVNEKQNTIYKKEEMERLMTYAATIEKTYGNMVKLKHDYKNMLIVTQHDCDSSNKLSKMLSGAFSTYETDDITEGLTKIANIPVKSLLASKLIDFINKGIHVSFSVLGEKIEQLYIDDFDAVRILGILLDNAFEEAAETEEKHINIAAMQEKRRIVFCIENSCRDSLPDSRDFIKKGFSTKSKDRGIGLSIFNEIISKYPYCSFCFHNKRNNMFSVELILANSDSDE